MFPLYMPVDVQEHVSCLVSPSRDNEHLLRLAQVLIARGEAGFHAAVAEHAQKAPSFTREQEILQKLANQLHLNRGGVGPGVRTIVELLVELQGHSLPKADMECIFAPQPVYTDTEQFAWTTYMENIIGMPVIIGYAKLTGLTRSFFMPNDVLDGTPTEDQDTIILEGAPCVPETWEPADPMDVADILWYHRRALVQQALFGADEGVQDANVPPAR